MRLRRVLLGLGLAVGFFMPQYGGALELLRFDIMIPGGRPGHEGLVALLGDPQIGAHPCFAALSAQPQSATFRLISTTGAVLATLPMIPAAEPSPGESDFEGSIEVPAESFRVSVGGIDDTGLPFSLTFTKLFHPSQVNVVFDQALFHLDALQLDDMVIGATVSSGSTSGVFRFSAHTTGGCSLDVSPPVFDFPQNSNLSLTVRQGPLTPCVIRSPEEIQLVAWPHLTTTRPVVAKTVLTFQLSSLIFFDGFESNGTEQWIQ